MCDFPTWLFATTTPVILPNLSSLHFPPTVNNPKTSMPLRSQTVSKFQNSIKIRASRSLHIINPNEQV